MNKVYCPSCREKVEYTIRENAIKEYKGYPVNVTERIAVCSKCKSDIFVPDIEEENYKNLYDQYRKTADIITPESIVEFRNKYSISQRELVAILGWGKMTLNRYERGAIPNSSHNEILKMISSNESFLLDKLNQALNEKRISDKVYNKIYKNVETSNNNQEISKLINELTDKENEFNGYRKFDAEKLENLIGYISEQVELYKTSLNKYLWYIDFENFKRNVRSITGLKYMRYTYGPVIQEKKYEEILNLFNDKFYKEEYEEDRGVITKIKSKKNYDLSIFNEEEIDVINNVISKFKNWSCAKVSNCSHKEDAWIENTDWALISYEEYADKLKVKFDN
jgi:putative zinc finger/helix-turn-helix YgiT family protein